MPGRPRTRAKREAAAAAAAGIRIPDAQPIPAGTPVPNTRTHARVSPPRMAMPGFVGNQTKAAADTLEAERLRAVASQIRPGVTVQIERTRPTWCAGYLEDYPIDQDGEAFAELRAYVRDTYGGARFRLTVISSSGITLAEGNLPVAAPPRHFGKPIDRERWEGNLSQRQDAPTTARAPEASPIAAPAASANETLLGLVLGLVKDSNQATLTSVREMTAQTREQTADLVKAIIGTRSEERRERSITTQLGELVDVTRAVDKVNRQLFGAAARGQQGDPDEQADREASRFFTRAVFGKMFGVDPTTGGPSSRPAAGGAGAPPTQQQPPRRRVMIPDAAPAPNGKGNN